MTSSSDDSDGSNTRFKKAASKLITGALAVKKLTLHFPSGDIYVGDFDTVKACCHGWGEYTWCNQARYVGEWFNGKRTGEGKLYDRPNNKFSKRQSVYFGTFQLNKREGKGRFERCDGAVYDGEWKEDKMNGRGTFTYANGDVYIGHWKAGAKHGRGEYVYCKESSISKAPAKYRGEFRNGLAEGQGESLNIAGDRYFGSWHGGERGGRGAYKFRDNGRVYRGEWQNDKANGLGLLTRPGRDFALAASAALSPSSLSLAAGARGETVPPTAATSSKTYQVLLPGETLQAARAQAVTGGEVVVYEGPFKDGLQHGARGREVEISHDGEINDDDDGSIAGEDELAVAATTTMTMTSKKLDSEDSEAVIVPGHAQAVYTGPFSEGVRDSYGDSIAFGRLKEANGSLYVGWVHADMRHGTHGDQWDANMGDRYIGNWFEDRRHGLGKRWSKDGSVYQGNWRNNKPHGRGETTWRNGDTYVGMYHGGVRNGVGRYCRGRSALDVYIGQWRGGCASGRGARTYPDGTFYIGDFRSNKCHGCGVMRHGDGSWYYGSFRAGKRHGFGVELNNGSGTRFEGRWVDGLRDSETDLSKRRLESLTTFLEEEEAAAAAKRSGEVAPKAGCDYSNDDGPFQQDWEYEIGEIHDNDEDDHGHNHDHNHDHDDTGEDKARKLGGKDESKDAMVKRSNDRGCYVDDDNGSEDNDDDENEGCDSSLATSSYTAEYAPDPIFGLSSDHLHPSRYFDPAIHTHVMVQRWKAGRFLGEWPDRAPQLVPKLPVDPKTDDDFARDFTAARHHARKLQDALELTRQRPRGSEEQSMIGSGSSGSSGSGSGGEAARLRRAEAYADSPSDLGGAVATYQSMPSLPSPYSACRRRLPGAGAVEQPGTGLPAFERKKPSHPAQAALLAQDQEERRLLRLWQSSREDQGGVQKEIVKKIEENDRKTGATKGLEMDWRKRGARENSHHSRFGAYGVIQLNYNRGSGSSGTGSTSRRKGSGRQTPGLIPSPGWNPNSLGAAGNLMSRPLGVGDESRRESAGSSSSSASSSSYTSSSSSSSSSSLVGPTFAKWDSPLPLYGSNRTDRTKVGDNKSDNADDDDDDGNPLLCSLSSHAQELRDQEAAEARAHRLPYQQAAPHLADDRRKREHTQYEAGQWLIVLHDDGPAPKASAAASPFGKAESGVENPQERQAPMRDSRLVWLEAVVIRFKGNPGIHELRLCRGPFPLEPLAGDPPRQQASACASASSHSSPSGACGALSSPSLELELPPRGQFDKVFDDHPSNHPPSLVVHKALTGTNHLAHPGHTNVPWLRMQGLPAPGLDVTARRKELLQWRWDLACQPGWSDEQKHVSGFVMGRAKKVIQDALDKADTFRRENIERRKAAQAVEMAARRTGIAP